MEYIRTKDRVQKLGEVFTRTQEVNAMLDLLPEITIEMTFLEPTCGNGNFVVEILKRKFDLCKKKADFITALESVYAIDIMADNVEECKSRVKELYNSYGQKENVDFILDTQIFQGNSLAIMKLLELCNRNPTKNKCEALKQALADIKEIVEPMYKNYHQEPELVKIHVFNKILQKISEVENDR